MVPVTDLETGRRVFEPYIDPHDYNHNSFERGIVYDTRGGGKVPYLDENRRPITIMEWANSYRRKFQEAGLA